MAGATPPRSSAQRVPGASLLRKDHPTRAEPIKLKKATRGSVTSRSRQDLVARGGRFGTRVRPGLPHARASQIPGSRAEWPGRLDDNRAAGGNRRGHLMHDQVKGMVEG